MLHMGCVYTGGLRCYLSDVMFCRYPYVDTEFKLFENRGHSLASDHGWTELAEYSLQWLKEKAFDSRRSLNTPSRKLTSIGFHVFWRGQ